MIDWPSLIKSIMHTSKSFPNLQQKPSSKACGPVCLHNIYSHLNINIDLETILNDLKVDSKTTTHLPQLAKHINQKGVKTVLLSSCSFNIAPEWKNKSKKKIISNLKKWIKYNSVKKKPQQNKSIWIKDARFLVDYLKEGGSIKILNLTTAVIDKYLNEGYIILSCLEESWLWGKRKVREKQQYDSIKGGPRGHFVIIFDKTRKQYIISDPYPTLLKSKERIYKVSKERLLISTLIWGAQVLAIKAK